MAAPLPGYRSELTLLEFPESPRGERSSFGLQQPHECLSAVHGVFGSLEIVEGGLGMAGRDNPKGDPVLRAVLGVFLALKLKGEHVEPALGYAVVDKRRGRELVKGFPD